MWKYLFVGVAIGHLVAALFGDFTTTSKLQPFYFLTVFWICFSAAVLLQHLEPKNKTNNNE